MVLDALKAFCAKDNFRYTLDSPWFANGLAIASDDKILVSFPSEPFEFPMDGKRPDVAKLLEEPEGLEFVELSSVPRGKPCERCSGSGKTNHVCGCDECTTKQQDCFDCNGTGRQEIEIQGHHFCPAYLRKIETLGAAVVAVGNKILWFHVGNYRGALMSLTIPAKH